MDINKKYPQKILSDDPNAILIPLYDSNMADVNIINQSKNLIFVVRSVISGIPNFFLNT